MFTEVSRSIRRRDALANNWSTHVELADIARHNFVYWMKAEGRQQKWVAEKLGVTENTVCRWKSGKMDLSLGQIGKIAQLMEIPAFLMFVEDGAKSPEEAAKLFSEIIDRLQSDRGLS